MRCCLRWRLCCCAPTFADRKCGSCVSQVMAPFSRRSLAIRRRSDLRFRHVRRRFDTAICGLNGAST